MSIIAKIWKRAEVIRAVISLVVAIVVALVRDAYLG